MADIKSTDIKVGETYRVRLGRGAYGVAKVDAIHVFGRDAKVVTGVKVTWLDGDRKVKVVNPATLETA